jgi:hypothetical protein
VENISQETKAATSLGHAKAQWCAALHQDPPRRYSAKPTWEGKVAEVQELARRAAVKKRKLTEAVEQLVAEGGHHLVDAEGLAGLDSGVGWIVVGAGIVNEEDYDESD